MIRSCQPDPNNLTPRQTWAVQKKSRKVAGERGEKTMYNATRVLALEYTRGVPERLEPGVGE